MQKLSVMLVMVLLLSGCNFFSPLAAVPEITPSVIAEYDAHVSISDNGVQVVRLDRTPIITPILTPTETDTPTPEPSSTPTSTPAPTVTPTPTPTPKPVVELCFENCDVPANIMPQPQAGEICPDWIHDLYKVAAPNSRRYPTWHPQVYPAVDPSKRCRFDHEHGDDPRLSVANRALPPFGYVAELAGMSEPHRGFKIGVANEGRVNKEGYITYRSFRVDYHMGVGGPGRFNQRFHSFGIYLVDTAVSGQAQIVSVTMMADTGGVGPICEDPRPGKTVMVIPSRLTQECIDSIKSVYEIWLFSVTLPNGRGRVAGSAAAFDPITAFDPLSKTQIIYMDDAWADKFNVRNPRGCNREYYGGPINLKNAGKSVVFWTTAMGVEVAAGTPGAIPQYVASIDSKELFGASMIMATRNDGAEKQTQTKQPTVYCAPGLGLGN